MKEQIKAPEKIQLSHKEIANLSDTQFKTLVIRMLTELVEYGHKLDEKNEGYEKWNKGKYTENQQWREGNQDLNQQFGAEERNIQLEQNEKTRIPKNEETSRTSLNVPTSES